MKLKIFCHCSFFPSWSAKDLSAPLHLPSKIRFNCGVLRTGFNPSVVYVQAVMYQLALD